MTLLSSLALVLSLGTRLLAAPALACDSVGPDTHVGVVTAVDRARSTLTLRDAETGGALTFVARPELLRGIAPNDAVSVTFAAEGKTLRATSVEKSGR
jgi:hypothetical protein